MLGVLGELGLTNDAADVDFARTLFADGIRSLTDDDDDDDDDDDAGERADASALAEEHTQFAMMMAFDRAWCKEGIVPLVRSALRLLHGQTDVRATSGLPQQFYRISGDRNVYYGDGGASTLNYPVVEGAVLLSSNKTRVGLLRELRLLGEESQDWHEKEPLLDLIDPNLFPLRLPEPDDESMLLHEHELDMQLKKNPKLESQIARERRKRERKANPYASQSEAARVRQLYQWLPAEVDIDAKGRCKFVTKIHHSLPRSSRNEKLYVHLEDVLSGMMPQFAELGLVELAKCPPIGPLGLGEVFANGVPDAVEFKPCRRKVVVKAQSMILKQSQAYDGRWHKEGLTENVLGVGVFYARVDKQMEGGNVKFRPEDGPGEHYGFVNEASAATRQGRVRRLCSLMRSFSRRGGSRSCSATCRTACAKWPMSTTVRAAARQSASTSIFS